MKKFIVVMIMMVALIASAFAADLSYLENFQVKEGDTVIYSKYAGTEVKLDEDEYIIVSQDEIIAVVE